MLSERRSSFSTPVEPLGRGRKGGEGMVPGLCLLDSPPVSPAREEEDGQWKEEQKLEAHSDWVRDVAWAPSIGLPTSTIASCSQVSSDPCRRPTLVNLRKSHRPLQSPGESPWKGRRLAPVDHCIEERFWSPLTSQ